MLKGARPEGPAPAQSGNHQVSEVPQEQIPHTPTTPPYMRKSTLWGGYPNRTPTPHGESIRPAEGFPPSPPSLFLLVTVGKKCNIQDGREGQGPCDFLCRGLPADQVRGESQVPLNCFCHQSTHLDLAQTS